MPHAPSSGDLWLLCRTARPWCFHLGEGLQRSGVPKNVFKAGCERISSVICPPDKSPFPPPESKSNAHLVREHPRAVGSFQSWARVYSSIKVTVYEPAISIPVMCRIVSSKHQRIEGGLWDLWYEPREHTEFTVGANLVPDLPPAWMPSGD